jgi:hypothetical protein
MMSRFTAFQRAAAATGATGLIALSLAGPASARPDPGTGELPRCTSGCYQGGTGPGTTPPPASTGSDGIEYLQLGAGILAGIALAGAGMAVASRRNHAHVARPA